MERVNATSSTPGARAITFPVGLPLGQAGGYTPGDIATAYGVNAAGGAGQTIGLVDAYNDPTALNDLDTFDAQYGLAPETTTGSAPSFEKVSVTGSDPSGLPTAVGTGWDGEETLDMEAARGLCHGCRIIMVEVASDGPADLAAGVNEVVALGATVVSNSWGQPDVAPTTDGRPAFNADFDHPGIPILDATGDIGWYGWTQANDNGTPVNKPFTPATLPTVVAVGGTTLTLNADGTRAAETVWNEVGASDHAETGGGASGGGCSLPGYYTAPSWQQAMTNFASLGCGTGRSATDVAVDADASTGYDL
jgi:subtilase family serine protease